jgi:preprotein translocase subunit SecE
MIERLTNYLKGVRQEVSRVSWPTRNEVISLTALILLLAVIVTLYIWGVDGVIGTILNFFIGLSG